EAVPAVPLGPGAEALEVLRIADEVVLAGYVGDVPNLGPLENLHDRVELAGCGEVGQVAGVDQQVRALREPVDLVDGGLGRGGAATSLSGSWEKPMWLSLTWTKEKLSPAGRSCPRPKARDERRPPPTVQTRPVPAQAMHSRNPRRSMPSASQSPLLHSVIS